jgi:hypothetical protein
MRAAGASGLLSSAFVETFIETIVEKAQFDKGCDKGLEILRNLTSSNRTEPRIDVH